MSNHLRELLFIQSTTGSPILLSHWSIEHHERHLTFMIGHNKISSALRHEDPSIRKEALEELEEFSLPRGKNGWCNDGPAMTAAIALLDDSSPDVRRGALQVCVNITVGKWLFEFDWFLPRYWPRSRRLSHLETAAQNAPTLQNFCRC